MNLLVTRAYMAIHELVVRDQTILDLCGCFDGTTGDGSSDVPRCSVGVDKLQSRHLDALQEGTMVAAIVPEVRCAYSG